MVVVYCLVGCVFKSGSDFLTAPTMNCLAAGSGFFITVNDLLIDN